MSDNFKDTLAKFINNPEVQKIQDELADFIKDTYAKFDATVYVGETCANMVRVSYCYKDKGFVKVEVDDAIYKDKQLALDFIPLAINQALVKYNEDRVRVEKLLADREMELYNKLVEIAQRGFTATQAEPEVPSLVKPKNKNLLN
jgi:hypothetical protein